MTKQELEDKIEKSIELSIIDLKTEGIEKIDLFTILAKFINFIHRGTSVGCLS